MLKRVVRSLNAQRINNALRRNKDKMQKGHDISMEDNNSISKRGLLMTYSEIEQRDICRRHIESFEHWSRRIIDEEMKKKFGNDYFSATNDSGHPLIKKEITELIKSRKKETPLRYPRNIDAILFDDIAYFLCRDDLYKELFRSFLEPFFSGQSEVRFVLERLKVIRNKLSHGNAISAHDAEQVICYSNDFIDTYKAHYIKRGREREYNVPLFIKLSDSLGRAFFRSETYDWSIYDHQSKIKFHSGESYKVWVEIDSNFSSDSYSLNWAISYGSKEKQVGNKRNSLDVVFTNEMVGHLVTISCHLKTKNTWHKRPHYDCDDILELNIGEILPPADSNY